MGCWQIILISLISEFAYKAGAPYFSIAPGLIIFTQLPLFNQSAQSRKELHMQSEWFDPNDEAFNISDYLEQQIEVDEQGLACNIEQLRNIIHDLTVVIYKLTSIPQVKENIETETFEDIVTLASSAHSLVCPGTEEEQQAEMFDKEVVISSEELFDQLLEPMQEAGPKWFAAIHNRDPQAN
jgi:hypothetical protein